jgi:hypothetical protein
MLSTRMPGRSHAGPLPPMTATETAVGQRLLGHVQHLATAIGERNVWRGATLDTTAAYVRSAFADGFHLDEQSFEAGGVRLHNVVAEKPGASDGIVVVGAHYDSVRGCPGANDNGSGVAALLEIARLLAPYSPARTLRFVAFPNEEAPFFGTDAMGSLRYARRCRERGEAIEAMLSLETLGYYRDEPGTQAYPLKLGALGYPPAGNFVAFVSDTRSKRLLHRIVDAFRRTTAFPSEGLAAPAWVPGVAWSDHAAFWGEGYPGVMVTDTAPFRYPQYHTPDDTADKLDYDRLARVTVGLARVVSELAGMAYPAEGPAIRL